MSVLFLAAAVTACDNKEENTKPDEEQGQKEDDKDDETGDDPENSVFKLSGTLPTEVNVTLDEIPLYKYAFGYDEYKRLSTFKLTCNGNILQSLSVTQDDAVRQHLVGKYSNSQFDVSISVRWASGSLVWAYEGVENPNRYVVTCGDDNLPKKFYYNIAYAAAKYENKTAYYEMFTSDGKNLVGESYNCEMKSTGIKGLKGSSGPLSKMNISYSSYEDKSNIGSFFLGEDFIVWYSKGLPGNKNLISKIEYSCDDTKLARTDEFSYETDSATGLVNKMTVKQFYNTTLEHTYIYSFKY